MLYPALAHSFASPSRLVSISMVGDRVEYCVGDAHDTAHFRAEAALRCKRTHENKVLMNEGACTTPTKIDGIITDKDFNLEVAIIEISGPNNKVDNTHYLEDKKKTAKNLRYMYEAIMSLKSKPSFELKTSLKVYGFHIYRKSSNPHAIILQLLTNYYSEYSPCLQFEATNTERPIHLPTRARY